MALATFNDLVAAIPAWITRTDATSALISDWVSLAEARINRVLRVNRMLVRATATISDEFSAVPSDFRAPRLMRVAGSGDDFLDFLTPEQMAQRKAEQPTGDLSAYALVGEEFWFSPVPTDPTLVELAYYGSVPTLGTTNPTNWLLTRHPDLYLAGTILESALYYEDDEQEAKWSDKFNTAIVDIHASDLRDMNAATLTPKPSVGSVVP
jgi:hypothetical protein